jgi:hypothetical protein
MTATIRYVQDSGVDPVDGIKTGSTGKDSQLIAFDITAVGGIAANTNANILQWTGAGKIQSVISFYILTAAGGINVPVTGATTSVTIDATGKIINVAVANGGTAIAANSVIKLLLVIGNY